MRSMDQFYPVGKSVKSSQLLVLHILQVYNGNSLHSTFVSNSRIDQFKEFIDPRTEESFKLDKVRGTGRLSELVFWIDAGTRTCIQCVH
jgi:hypothetical protein